MADTEKKPTKRIRKNDLGIKYFKSLRCNLVCEKDFKLAFEVEFVFDASKTTFQDISTKVRQMRRGTKVGGDGSIRFGGKFSSENGAEIKTPPLYPIPALNLLKKIFNYVDKIGYTNESCGLHLNFSPCSDDRYYSLNPFSFTSEAIWEEIVREFRRESNNYCKKVWPQKPKNLLEIWSRLIYSDDHASGHYSVVNMAHYHLQRNSNSRIEVRGFGNEDYHKKFVRIALYTEKVFETFLRNCHASQIPLPTNGVSSGTVESVNRVAPTVNEVQTLVV